MDKFAKRLQSRLSAKGYRFNKEDCRQALACASATPAEPTEEEMILAFDRLALSVQAEEFSQAQEPEMKIEAIVPAQADEEIIPQAQKLTPEIQEPKMEKASLTVADSQEIAQLPVAAGGITQAEVTEAISQAAQQVGVQGDAEAIQALTSLAQILSDNNRNTQDMVAALVSAYLNERRRIFSSAIGTLNTLRSAQTESFQSGLDENFFQQRELNKRQFLEKIGAMFN